jgi:hypothetical protein
MATKKKHDAVEDEKNTVTPEMGSLIEQISSLVKLRHTLTYGTATGARNSAESVMSRAINGKVTELAKLILKNFDT